MTQPIETRYKSPQRKLVRFFEKSRDQWKAKCQTAKFTVKRLQNLAGQDVTTLVEGMRQAGSYSIHWDGRDDAGRELASGVYLYRLRTGDGRQGETRKLVLVR